MRLPRRHELVPLHTHPIPPRLLGFLGINWPESDEEDRLQGHDNSQQGESVTRQGPGARTTAAAGTDMHDEEESSAEEEEDSEEEGWEEEDEEEDWKLDMNDPAVQKKVEEKYLAKE